MLRRPRILQRLVQPACFLVLLMEVVACSDGSLSTARPTVSNGTVRSSELQAGPATVDIAARNPYASDAVALNQGRRLYTDMNCAGCHGGAGGGGIGPPLADSDWIYGGQPENIVQAILEGRPNGMPAFGPRLPEDEAWKIATYVTSLAKKSGSSVPSTTGAGSGQSSR